MTRHGTERRAGGLTTRHRWLRLAIPFAVVALLFLVTGVAHYLEEPDPGDPGTFSPTGTGPDGSSRLAEMLAARNIPIERVTRSTDAVRAAARGDATIFIPAPDMPNQYLVRVLAALPAENRVVLVEPGARHQAGLPIVGTGQRWAPRTPRPGCADPVAREAGRATATRTRYSAIDVLEGRPVFGTTDHVRCYNGGLLALRWQRLELVLVGASDPFRNNRIGEHGNAKLATGLLATKQRVIWLDLHAPEPVSYSEFDGGLGLQLPEADQGDEPAEPQQQNPLWTAVPPAFWPIMVQIALVALLLAVWRARRLGPPVAEPLPVLVPEAETVTGRGRLYQRAGARGSALEALRASARHRIQRLLDLPPEAAEADVVDAVAARARIPTARVRDILYGPEPPDDAYLVQATAALDTLVHTITHERKPAR
jgi:hypothetical protein